MRAAEAIKKVGDSEVFVVNLNYFTLHFFKKKVSLQVPMHLLWFSVYSIKYIIMHLVNILPKINISH